MNNLDGITSPLVALQLLSLCLPLSLMSDNGIMELALHVQPRVRGCEYPCMYGTAHFMELKLLPHLGANMCRKNPFLLSVFYWQL